jgi:hypothetical protein
MQMVQTFLSTGLVQISTTQIASSPSSSLYQSSPFTHVELNANKANHSGFLTINTNFKKSLNREFKPGRGISQEEIIALTDIERELAEAAVIPVDLDDFQSKVFVPIDQRTCFSFQSYLSFENNL